MFAHHATSNERAKVSEDHYRSRAAQHARCAQCSKKFEVLNGTLLRARVMVLNSAKRPPTVRWSRLCLRLLSLTPRFMICF